uniref:ER lumen protein-retaining receptor n=1 Tax=Chenopodium quinoa TaxID=63459 RepID=A0A803L213_CHEQI
MMNLFRLAGDMTHLLSIIVLLLKIHATKSCSGISLKTQELYVIVFLTRYLDLFTRFVSLYNTVMKIVFIGTSFAIVWYMRYHKVVKQTYSMNEDTLKHYFLLLPCFGLALLLHNEFTLMDVLWTFSLYLEAVAILPQLVLLQHSRNIDNLTGNYVFLLGYFPSISPYSAILFGLSFACSSKVIIMNIVSFFLAAVIEIAYRALYVLNWIYRYFLQDHRARWIPWISGLVQTALYADFFYYYVLSWKKHEKLKLPA